MNTPKPQIILNSIPLNETVTLIKKLISVNTTNPPGNEIQLLPIIKDAYNTIGAALTVVEKKKDRANFIGKIGQGSPVVGFFAHLDTVPPGDGWNTDPFEVHVKDGKLYGRGACDDKGNFATAWAAIKAFLKLTPHFKGTILLVGCADEETGSEYGVRHLITTKLKTDYAIVPDGGSINEIIIGEKGIIRLLVTSQGKQAHASTPNDGVNAIDKLITFLNAFNTISFDKLPYNALFSGFTKSIGVINGGFAVNIIPASAQCQIDIRYPLGITKETVMSLIMDCKNDVLKKDKDSHITIDEIFSSNPHVTDRNSSLIQYFLESAKTLGLDMNVGTMGGNTDAKPLYFNGVETLVHDLGLDTAHQANEYIEIESIKKAASLYVLTLMKLFKTG